MFASIYSRRAFTLIEMLTVFAIVALIAVILFPLFATVRERGRRTVCQSNLKQIAMAVQEYVQDNSQTYPLGGNWHLGVYPYLKSGQVYRCPSDQNEDFSTDQVVTGPPNSPESYSPVDYRYNWHRLNDVQTFALPLPPDNSKGTNESALAFPALVWLNMDLGYETEDQVYHNEREIMLSCGRLFDGSTQHTDAGNYSYLDGHVKWLRPEEAGEIECKNGPLPAPFTN